MQIQSGKTRTRSRFLKTFGSWYRFCPQFFREFLKNDWIIPSPEALAAALGVNVSYVRRFLRLTLLAPPIVEAIFEGRAPWSLSLTKLDTNLPFSWQEQLKLFGME